MQHNACVFSKVQLHFPNSLALCRFFFSQTSEKPPNISNVLARSTAKASHRGGEVKYVRLYHHRKQGNNETLGGLRKNGTRQQRKRKAMTDTEDYSPRHFIETRLRLLVPI